jgi:flagellar hook-basal body complex protein FliE
MPPKHRQLRAPRPKAPGNAFQALVNPPNDGNNLSIDGGDRKVDATDDNNAVNASQRTSTTAASPEQLLDDAAQLVQITNLYTTVATSTRDYVQKTSDDMHDLLIEMDECANVRLEPFYTILEGLLQRIDTVLNDNTELRAAYDASTAETAALKAAVDTLTRKFDKQIAIPAPPSPDLTASSTTMEEMTMQLSVVQHDIQDVLEAVGNPPGKRERRTSNQDTEPTTPTNRRPATNRQGAASPEHSLMHSQHMTSAAQDALDALLTK